MVTDVGAARDVVKHGVNGFVIDPGDDASLRDHLRALARDHEVVETMGEAARFAATSRFSLDDVARALRTVYVDAAVARGLESPCSS